MADETIIEETILPTGTLNVGERDTSGQRFETFDPKITSESLKPATPIDFKTPEETPIFPVAMLTPTEETVQEKTEDIQSLTEQLIGQSEFRTGQEEAQGLPALQQTQTDLSARLKALSNEALAIPLQLQQEATGRGITAGGLRPLQTARLRENAIQALSVNSLLEASRGNITTAQDMINRAVAQKYDPIKEEIAVKKANLELILQSPQYTLEQKNQAQTQLDIQNAKLAEATKAEAEETAIKNIAVSAATQGVDAMTLGRIQAAPSEAEATRIAQEAGVFDVSAEVDQFTLSPGQKRYDAEGNLIVENIKEAKELTKIELLNIENKKLDIAQKIKDLADTDLDDKTISQVDKLSSSFDSSPIVKNFNDVQNKKLSIDAIVENGVGGPADLALVFEFMKALDPTSVVRESEYDSASKAGNIFKGWAAKFNGYLKAEGGLLPDEVKQEFKRLSGDKFDIITRQYDNLRDEKGRLIDQKTGDTDGLDYLIDYNFTKKPEGEQIQFNTVDDFLLKATDEQLDAADNLKLSFPDLSDDDLLELINEQLGFNSVGGDTNKAVLSKVSVKENGDKGGQCGKFVNNITKLGVGDSFNSKMAKMDDNITQPEAGMVFTMPYKDTGHCGIILAIDNGIATVKDSNWSLDEKIKTHKIPVNKMTGFSRA